MQDAVTIKMKEKKKTQNLSQVLEEIKSGLSLNYLL